jgi:DNA-binding NtrC family response regulator
MCRVLIVDDEEEVRAAIQRRLGRDKLEANTASGEAEAIKKIQSMPLPYDVVLTDMVMENPDSGLNVLQAALFRDIFTEVIILTAYGNVANAVESMKRGAADYVEKNIPGVDVYDLMSQKVSAALERRRQSMNTVRRIDYVAKMTGMK